MSDESTWVFVDDRDSGITYNAPSGATIWLGGTSQEYDQTTTGLESGDTLTYYFNASRIGVFGTYSPTGTAGPPITRYQVDNSTATTVTGPVSQTALYRQAFWLSDSLPSLAPGAFHKLALTASVPNTTIWVDYLAYPPATSATTTSISSTGTGVPSTPSTTSSTVATVTGNQTNSGTSDAKTNTPAMIAGVVVGVIALILAGATFAYVRGRRSHPTATEHLIRGQNEATPHMTQTDTVTLDSPPPDDSPSHSTIPQQDGPQESAPRPLPPVPVRTFDGGVRIMGGPLETPPEYQEHY